jgi:HD superfamily phosphohydrolase
MSQFETEGVDLLADSIYNFVRFTIPTRRDPNEIAESSIINSPWLQRLREIYQLQAVRWVYPGGEHTRFQHAIGAMELGGRFARRVYDSLKDICHDAPSQHCVEETLRITGLLHDVGHGPFGHFFDHNFLRPIYHITHEQIGQRIIQNKLASLISAIKRSPSGRFDETLDPAHIAYLIYKHARPTSMPRWVQTLKPLITGVYTIDNLDYVSRDSHACGLSTGSLFVDRLLHYTYVSEQGLTLHQRGIAALKMFLTVKAYLFSNVYFHRTVRALDLHLKEIFRPTLEQIVRQDPRTDLASYMRLTDQSLFATVRSWGNLREGKKKVMATEWSKLLGREKKWIYVSGDEVPFEVSPPLHRILSEKDVSRKMRRRLPGSVKFKVDVSTHDPRPENLTRMGQEQFFVYDPGKTPEISKSVLENYFRGVASLVVQCRVYALDRNDGPLLKEAFEKAIGRTPSEPTAV